ncbi:MAG: undecaprenyl/decaprenyl-phosphate alpha-N-acetylglucosaminyl 1-phosphate transferase [Myxococcales bacterium FL481]|nr:MAG: undecaprenyl/decaprenyl-phosphate alpha-N-acetylglucosaminyl 1-phosphate transferase [Myxococcales bacterium FL481]
MQTIPSPLLAACLAFVLVALMMPGAARLWQRLGGRDDERSLRKIHSGQIPRVGGLVMALALGALFVIDASTDWLGGADVASRHGIVVGASGMAVIGLADDLFGLRPRSKLLLQAIVVAAAVYGGVRWEALERLFDRNLASLVLTGVFVLAVTNAINFVDGLDGLAGGNLAAGFLVVCASAWIPDTVPAEISWLACAAVGAVAGFLVFNRHPARVFMGDTGAYFLGFLLVAVLFEVRPSRPRMWLTHAAIPLLTLALPLLDMGLAVTRRAVRGQSVFVGDSDHVHHRLLARGFSHRASAAMLTGVALAFATLAYLTVVGASGQWTLVLALLLVATLCGLLGYHRVLLTEPTGTAARRRTRQRHALDQLRIQVAALCEEAGPSAGPAWWHRLREPLEAALVEAGVTGFDIEHGGVVVIQVGQPVQDWAWLALALPGDGTTRLRLRMDGGVVSLLRADQVEMLDGVVKALAGPRHGRRHPTETPTWTASVDQTPAQKIP